MSNTSIQVLRILLIDDHAMFRDGLARLLDKEPDFTVVGQVSTASEGLAALPRLNADIVLLDVDLGPERALDFVKGARAAGFQGRILIVTAGMSDQEAVQLVQAGVVGILHKHHSADALSATIRRIANGEVCLEQAYLGPLFRVVDRTTAPKRASLTDRDKTIMRGILQGLSNREIAGRLQISEGAVKASVRHVCEKLGVRTRSQLVKVALEQYKDQL
ncbi:MAG TPA: response regulator transcription factor [Bryobacteraceae bacterium]|jgi:two-component system nitrate/nitrite response regulator NarL